MTLELFDLWHSCRFPLLLALVAAALVYRFQCYIQGVKRKEARGISTLKPAWVDAPVAEAGVQAKPVVKTNGIAKESGPKRVVGNKKKLSRIRKKGGKAVKEIEEGDFDIQILIFYSTLTGSTHRFAEDLKNDLFSSDGEAVYPALSIPTPSNSLSSVFIKRKFLPPVVHNLEEVELDDFFVTPPKEAAGKVKYIYLLLLPTYETDPPIRPFLEHLRETHHDFRIDTAPLRSLAGFSVFGFGDSSEWPAEEGKFCKDALEVDKWMGKLTGGRSETRRMFPVGMGDVNPAAGLGSAEASLKEWRTYLEDAMREYAATGALGDAVDWRTAIESGDEDSDFEVADAAEDMVDVEDIGGVIRKNPDVAKKGSVVETRRTVLPVDFTTPAGKKALEQGEGQSADRKDMVPKGGVTYEALTKQGYTIVGSHSGVKICRWTKSALRGRGSCYKFSFYGIKSHLCMETTPSLSCSNKCVFCWRHGTNPVGTTWRWKVDPPEEIFKGVVEGHYRKIKMMKGVPGVRADRFSEAFKIRHCALSLVGEPIFYPYVCCSSYHLPVIQKLSNLDQRIPPSTTF